MKTAYQLYLKEIENIPIMSKKAEVVYFDAWKKGNEKARLKIYSSNLRFVVKVAHNYKNQGIAILDLISEGNLALDLALERFDHKSDNKFISYAVWYIRQAILELLARQSRFVSIHGAEAVFKANLNKARNKLMQKLGREPSEEELANDTGFTIVKVRHMEKMLQNNAVTSIDSPVGDGNKLFKDIIPDDKFDSPEPKDNMSKLVLTYMNQAELDEQEINVITSYFGINREPRNLEEISFDYDLSRERMRQIKEKALNTLQAFAKKSEKLNVPTVINELIY